MAEKLSDKAVREAPGPTGDQAYKITYDIETVGFGVRTTKGGQRSFVLNYRSRGIERRYTIGRFPDWSTSQARQRAKELKRLVDQGRDPMGELHEERSAPTVADLCARYLEEHAAAFKRERSRKEDGSLIRLWVAPSLGRRKVDDIEIEDIERLHRRITVHGAPVSANRTVALCSKMFALSIRWRMRDSNPVAGIKRNAEQKRRRYLKGDELRRLSDVLAQYRNQTAANAVRLLLLTGARRGELFAAQWSEFDLTAGTWTKPSAHTKTKIEHEIPLSAPVRLLLAQMQAERTGAFLFPGPGATGHLVELKSHWQAICRAAELVDVHLHDLRHSYASVLVSAGLSLEIIGSLLGHTQITTTQRYAHLAADPLRKATETAGAIIEGAATVEVVNLHR